ncbi:MAG TPA: DNA methyltransferase [candidate division Zixibacteria bacterium]|nr:DNA methyltransferase [candidate division Zixibacteria bacterium]
MRLTIRDTSQKLTIREASEWASTFLEKEVSESNISYLIQYGKVRKYNGNGATYIDRNDLEKYYKSYHGKREINWKKKLGDDLNWALSFDNLREKDTTKHVHRLHPYKGKFIPQLVQYFIDDHTDNFKKEVYFRPGDILLDPFAGSGTTLVQANELGINSIGIDISRFNCMIAEAKLYDYELVSLEKEIRKIVSAIVGFEADSRVFDFELKLLDELSNFNSKYFPSPGFKYDVEKNRIDECKYSVQKEKTFLKTYKKLVQKYGIELTPQVSNSFLDKWYMKNIRDEIDFAFQLVKQVKEKKNREILAVILSRTIRSCRATTHSDLATLVDPQLTTYYCHKHKKICKPLFSIKYWFERYAIDTLKRLVEYKTLKSKAHWISLAADSQTVDIFKKVARISPDFGEDLVKKRIKGIFTSPPYVGQIDYHEQHAYAYDLFKFKRKDELEIGPLFKGQGAEARNSYIEGISRVMQNSKRFLVNDFDAFVVANDKFNLYPLIAEKSGMKIVNQFKRPVLNRTERDKTPYSEIIFHLKNGN